MAAIIGLMLGAGVLLWPGLIASGHLASASVVSVLQFLELLGQFAVIVCMEVALVTWLVSYLRRSSGNTAPRRVIADVVNVVTSLMTLMELHANRVAGKVSKWDDVAPSYSNMRIALRNQAWQASGSLAILASYRRRDRLVPSVAWFGRWVCWVSEDLDDVERIEACLRACVDVLRHTVSARPWRPVRLQPPPKAAVLLKNGPFERS
jgi:hypothetical protein